MDRKDIGLLESVQRRMTEDSRAEGHCLRKETEDVRFAVLREAQTKRRPDRSL